MKAALSINYDLRAPGKDYSGLYRAIQGVSDIQPIHPMGSLWVILTGKTCREVRDALSKHLDGNDVLLVSVMSGDWASWNLKPFEAEWLKQHT